MVFSDQTYSVLVVSAAQKFNEAFAAMLPGSEYYPVRFVGNIAAARREMVNKTFMKLRIVRWENTLFITVAVQTKTSFLMKWLLRKMANSI